MGSLVTIQALHAAQPLYARPRSIESLVNDPPGLIV